jgi:outer membrane receptor for ferrienterochelin and colicins
LFHLGANYKWDKDLTFSATIYNLFDKNLYKHEPYTYISGTPPKSTTAYADTDANLEGRRLWLAMNLAF